MPTSDADSGSGSPRRAQAPSRPPVNPWHRVLTGFWGGALVVAAVLAAGAFVIAYPGARTGSAGAATAAALLSGAGWFITVAVVAGIAQVAALAATWRPPEQ